MCNMIFILLIAGLLQFTWATEPEQPEAQGRETTGLLAAYTIDKYKLLSLEQPDQEEDDIMIRQPKSGLKAALMSVILPGSGEYYAKSYWKTAVFAALVSDHLFETIKFPDSGQGSDDIPIPVYENLRWPAFYA